MEFVFDGRQIGVIAWSDRHLDEAFRQAVKINFDRLDLLIAGYVAEHDLSR